MKTLVVFNNKGGVGKTTLVYHLAHMLSRLGLHTLAVDLDPQANLTSAFFEEDTLEELWEDGRGSILGAIKPLLEATGDIGPPSFRPYSDGLDVIVGDLGLSGFEDKLSEAWPRCMTNAPDALRVTTSFHRYIQSVGAVAGSDIALIDVGPNLGAINRAAVLTADYLLVPVAADLFSLQGLRNLGPTLRKWLEFWRRVKENPPAGFELPSGAVEAIGYVVLQHAVRLDRPVRHYEKWAARIPQEFRQSVLGREEGTAADPDPWCLAMVRNYLSLMPMAQEARRPVFALRASDGAVGSHAQLVRKSEKDFESLARLVAAKCGVTIA